MALTQTQVSQLYVTLFGRASEGAGNEYWQDAATDIVDGANQMLATEASQEYFGSSLDTDQAFIEHIYENTLGKTIDDDPTGIAYWVEQLGLDDVTRGDVVADLIAAVYTYADSDDAVTLAAYNQFVNRVAVSNYCADTLDGSDLDASDDAAMGVYAGYITSVTDDSATVTAAENTIFSAANPSDFTLTQLADTLTGNSLDNVFEAPVTQNTTGSGDLANTLETGDVLDGGDGQDILDANLIATGTIQDNNQGAAISATTTSIEEVYLTAITPQVDAATNTTFVSTVDAGDMDGVEEWWTDESRSDIQIEDIRTRPQETTFGVRLTDPNVGFSAMFNPLFMDGDLSSTSALTLILQEITDGQAPSATELENITVREINFSLDGVDYTLESEDVQAANTWAELETAIAAELVEQGLTDLTVTHTGNGVYEIIDSTGGTFVVEDGEALILGVASDIDTRNRVEVGLTTDESLISTTLILDGAGSGSQGGIVNIAAASGDRGVEVINVQVDRDSHISALASENNPNNTASGYETEQQLEEVYVTHYDADADGTLYIGTRTVGADGVSTTDDDRLNAVGLVNVRVFDATGFDSELKLGAQLNASVLDKYLDDATEPVQFSYLLGDAGSNLNLAVVNVVASDPDFMLDIIGGAGDDRINLTGLQFKASTTIDGAGGENTVEITTTTGAEANGNTAEENSWESFTNIDTLIIAGTNDTIQNLVIGNMAGVSDVIVASEAPVVAGVVVPVNTELRQLDALAQDLTISGINQTLGTGNNNNDQVLGNITLTDTTVPVGAVMDVLLQNTARVDGEMTVGSLVVTGDFNEITELNIESAGDRDTSNVIAGFDGDDVTTLNFLGTQDLAVLVNTSIANTATVDATITGAALEGDLILAVNAALLDGDDDDQLIGTTGTDDLVALYGNVTTDTDVSAFETMQFGWLLNNGVAVGAAGYDTSELSDLFTVGATAGGTYDATNTSDVETYIVGNLGANLALGIDGMRSDVVVQLGDDTLDPVVDGTPDQVIYTGATMDLTFTGTGASAQDNLTINALSALDAANFVDTVPGTSDVTLHVNNFENIDLDFDRTATSGAAEALVVGLDLDSDATTLDITGGNADEVISLTQTLGLSTSLTNIDITGFDGEVNLGNWDSFAGTNATIDVNSYNFSFDVTGVAGSNAVVHVAGGAGADAFEQATITFDAAANELDAGESVTITFAGGSYTYINNTGAAIAAGNLDAAIIADAANAPTAFSIADDGGGDILLTATTLGDMDGATLGATEATTDANLGAAAIAQNTTPGTLVLATGLDMVTLAPDFITSFNFDEDANEVGVVWQIDNFYAFEAGENVDLTNQSIIDLRDLGVDSATDITIQDAATFWASLTAAEQAEFNAEYTLNTGNFGVDFGATDTVITSNEGLNFTIVLTGVDAADVVNENIAGIA